MALIKLRRGLKANAPATVDAGEILLATDTKEILVGTVDGSAPVPIEIDMAQVKALLDANQKIKASHLPAIAITETFSAEGTDEDLDGTNETENVLSYADGTNASTQEGDIVMDLINRKNYVRNGVAYDGSGTQTIGDLFHELQDIGGQADFDNKFDAKTTDDLAEGATNLYFTDARARGAVSASGDLSYDGVNGVFSVTTYKSTDFDTDFAAKDTDGLSEGATNQYFTDARAQASAETKINSLKNVANGIAGLDANGDLDVSVLPASVVQAGDAENRLAFGGTAGQFAKSDGAGNLSYDDNVDGGSF